MSDLLTSTAPATEIDLTHKGKTVDVNLPWCDCACMEIVLAESKLASVYCGDDPLTVDGQQVVVECLPGETPENDEFQFCVFPEFCKPKKLETTLETNSDGQVVLKVTWPNSGIGCNGRYSLSRKQTDCNREFIQCGIYCRDKDARSC